MNICNTTKNVVIILHKNFQRDQTVTLTFPNSYLQAPAVGFFLIHLEKIPVYIYTCLIIIDLYAIWPQLHHSRGSNFTKVMCLCIQWTISQENKPIQTVSNGKKKRSKKHLHQLQTKNKWLRKIPPRLLNLNIKSFSEYPCLEEPRL